MERGCYADLTLAKSALTIADTLDDVRLARLLEQASRQVDLDTGRKFYTVTATRYYTAQRSDELIVPDLLSVPALHTDDGTRAYAEAWAVTDYETLASDSAPDVYPRWRVVPTPYGNYSFPTRVRRGVRITGVWGYGDGESATPWRVPGATVTVASTSATSVTVSSTTPFAVGQTLLAGSEQMYVQAIGPLELTVERGVNGTTAAVHAAAAASIARYPSGIVTATLARAEMDLRMPMSGALGGDGIGTVRDPVPYARYMRNVEQFRLAGVA